MERDENTVRVWVVRDLLQAQLMQQMLIDNGIECTTDYAVEMLAVGGVSDVGLWVSKQNEQRARDLLTEMEEEMSAGLDQELPDEGDTTPEGE